MTSLAENTTDYNALREAVALMNSPSITAKLANVVGTPVEALLGKLSPSMREKVTGTVTTALHKAADAAMWTMDDKPGSSASAVMHKIGAAASGAIGGFFGFSTVLVEIPVSITIMMRAVADIARAEGFSLADFETRAECVQIFGMDSGEAESPGQHYFAMKEVLRQVVSLTASGLAANAASRGINGFSSQEAASVLVKLIEAVAARFGVVITEKVAAQLVPVLGAVTGATINTLFTNHYQDLAKVYFTIKRLEQKYGEGVIGEAMAGMNTKPS